MRRRWNQAIGTGMLGLPLYTLDVPVKLDVTPVTPPTSVNKPALGIDPKLELSACDIL